MDAVAFLIEKDRMCRYYHEKNRKGDEDLRCRNCPFEESVQGITTSCCAYTGHMWNEEDYVKAVEKWSLEHRLITNREKFKRVYGFTPLMVLNPDDPWWAREYKEKEE